MNRKQEKRLEELEAAVDDASKPKQMIIGSPEARADAERIREGKPPKTAAELEKELEERTKSDRIEFESMKTTPDHKRLMLEQSEEGDKYRKKYFHKVRYFRLMDILETEDDMSPIDEEK